jgi:hypothetical protein
MGLIFGMNDLPGYPEVSTLILKALAAGCTKTMELAAVFNQLLASVFPAMNYAVAVSHHCFDHLAAFSVVYGVEAKFVPAH